MFFLLHCTWYNIGIPPSDTFIPHSLQTMAHRLSRGEFALLLKYSNNSGWYITITVSLYGEKVSYLKVCAPPLCPLTFTLRNSDWILCDCVVGFCFKMILRFFLKKMASKNNSKVRNVVTSHSFYCASVPKCRYLQQRWKNRKVQKKNPNIHSCMKALIGVLFQTSFYQANCWVTTSYLQCSQTTPTIDSPLKKNQPFT